MNPEKKFLPLSARDLRDIAFYASSSSSARQENASANAAAQIIVIASLGLRIVSARIFHPRGLTATSVTGWKASVIYRPYEGFEASECLSQVKQIALRQVLIGVAGFVGEIAACDGPPVIGIASYGDASALCQEIDRARFSRNTEILAFERASGVLRNNVDLFDQIRTRLSTLMPLNGDELDGMLRGAVQNHEGTAVLISGAEHA